MIKESTLLVVVWMTTCWMTGLIWMVQIVHYPLFAQYERSSFMHSMKQHQQRISMIVLPWMMVELGGSLWLWWHIWTWPHHLLMGLLAIIWLSTFVWQVPCHTELTAQWTPIAHRRLVMSNWVRTIAWSLRSLMLGWLILKFMV